jgi:hypothetical protein
MDKLRSLTPSIKSLYSPVALSEQDVEKTQTYAPPTSNAFGLKFFSNLLYTTIVVAAALGIGYWIGDSHGQSTTQKLGVKIGGLLRE